MTVCKEAFEHPNIRENPMYLICNKHSLSVILVHSPKECITCTLDPSSAPQTTIPRTRIPTASWFRPFHKCLLIPFVDMNDMAAVEWALQAEDVPWHFLRCLCATVPVAIFIFLAGLVPWLIIRDLL